MGKLPQKISDSDSWAGRPKSRGKTELVSQTERIVLEKTTTGKKPGQHVQHSSQSPEGGKAIRHRR